MDWRILGITTAINIAYLYLISNFSTLQILLIFSLIVIGKLYLIYLLRTYYELRDFVLWIALMILSIPTSFLNIFGGNYGSLPLSWYNIFFLMTFTSWLLHSRKFSKNRFVITLLFFSWLFVTVLKSYSLQNALRDFVNFVPILLFYSIKTKRVSVRTLNTLENMYIISGLSLVLPLLFQVISFLTLGKLFGKIEVYPGRIGFGVTFSDFSFLSLFFASSAALSLEKKRVPSLILLLSSLLTTARTGFFSFLIALILVQSIKLIKKQRLAKMIIFYALISLLSFLGIKILSVFRQEDLTDPTGRFESISKSISLIINSPIMGVGLGTEAFKKVWGFAIPHNLIFQLLLQTGFIGFLLFLFILVDVERKLWKSTQRSERIFLAFNTVLIGSMFIPDIMNSRFLPVLILLSLLAHETRRDMDLSCSPKNR